MYYYSYPKISAETVRKVRRACDEYQREFALRFEVSKRTIIRWEQKGVEYRHWETERVKVWRALLKKHPKAFTKDEREMMRK